MKKFLLPALIACLDHPSFYGEFESASSKGFDPRDCFRDSVLTPHAYQFESEPGAEIEAIKAEFTKTMGEMKDLIKKRDDEVKTLGESRAETGNKVKELDAKLVELGAQYAGVMEKFVALEKDHKELMAKQGRPGADPAATKQSIGEVLTKSEAYESMIKGNRYSSDAVKIDTFLFKEHKALSSASGIAGDLIDPFRVAGIFASPVRQFRLRDLLTINTTDELAVEYVEESAFYQLYTPITTQAASGQKDIIVKNSRGFFVGQTIIVKPGAVAEEEHVVAAVNHDTNTLTTTDNLSNTHAVGVEVVSGSFVYTPELQLKPTAHATFDLKTATLKTLAHWIPASRQILRNRNMLRQHVDTRLLQGLELSEEQQILYGDDSADQLQGIMSHAGAQSYDWSDGAPGDTKLDAIRRALTLSQLAHYPVDGCVLNPTDWEDIELAKGEDLHYIWVSPQTGGGMQLWRVPVVITTAMKPAEFLTGAFGLGAALWDGERASVRVSEHHEDYFTRNMVAILAEQLATQTVYRPEAFVVGTFDQAPAAEGG